MRNYFFIAIAILPFTVGCIKNNNVDDGNYKYDVASLQGTIVHSERYKRAILKSRRLIEEAGQWGGLPGAQIAVAVDGQICWSENFGFSDLKNGIPVKPTTLFRTASVSKLFTAGAVGKLIEEGKLDLDTPVINYMPELPEHYSKITVRHLISHQSGIRHYYGADKSEKTEHYNNVKETLDLFINAPLLFSPGENWEYSSYGWAIVSAVIERIAKKPFLQYMEEEIWDPMGLENTFGEIPETRKKDVTVFYLKNSPQGSWEEAPFQDLSFNWGGAGFSSNAYDLATFGNKLMNGHFLKKETVDLMFTHQLTNQKDSTGFGIGFTLYCTRDNERVIGHGGFMPTARTYLLLFPDDNIVVAFTCNTSRVNFADENILAIAHNFEKEKNDENHFHFNRALHTAWVGLWTIELEGDDNLYTDAHLYFYEHGNELKGTIFIEGMQPVQLEITELNESELELFAMLPAYTTNIKLQRRGDQLSGESYYNKPLTRGLKKEIHRNSELRKMFEPKRIQNGRKLN